MANQPFDQTIINALERPTSSDLNQAQGQAHADVRMLASKLFQAFGATAGQEGFVGDSFAVVPTSPASTSVVITNGIGFQNGSTETDIGGIGGLTDAYPYKTLTISNRVVPVAAPPSVAGDERWDLIEVRVPTGTERLTNQQASDIYNPTLNSFNATNVYKTLSSDLTSADIETIPYNGTPDGNHLIVYKTGFAEYVAGRPVVDAGYLPLGYIYRQNGAPNATVFEDARTTLGVTPNYGFGFSITDVYGSTSWTRINGLSVFLKLRDGLTRIRVQPQSNGFSAYLNALSTSADDDSIFFKFRITGTTSREFVFIYPIPKQLTGETIIPMPAIEDFFQSGYHSIQAWVKGSGTSTLRVSNLTLFVSQG